MAKGIRAVLYRQEPPTPKRSLVPDLGQTILKRSADAAITQYHELKRTNPNAYDFNESFLNQLGYMLLRENRNADAMAIFKIER
jgi:hypothetical protein